MSVVDAEVRQIIVQCVCSHNQEDSVMQTRRVLYLLAIVVLLAALAPVAAFAHSTTVSGAAPAADDPTEETLLEQAKAREAEQNPLAPRAPDAQSTAPSTDYPLFVGVDDTTISTYRIEPSTNAFQPQFTGFQVWGAAYDQVNNKVYFNNGSTLYEWPVGGAVTTLGTITDPGGATLSMVGLAFYNGVLYSVRNIANEAVYSIDTTTRVATVVIDYVDADFDLGGFAADPNTGDFYATNDDTSPNGSGLFRINPDGTGTLITPYPAGETDIDGLAVSHDGRAYLVTDQTGSIYVWDFGTAAYVTPLTNPWTTSEVFSAGAWIWEMTVTDPNIDVSPASLASAQAPNTTTQQILTIANTGGGSLDWTIFEDSTAAPERTDWSDNFDSYATGSQVHGQGGWKGWFNDPLAGALTSSNYKRSAPNSVDILGASDLVHEYSGYTSGQWIYTAWQYVPGAFTGQSYFILLNTYNDAGSGLNWSVQVQFDAAVNQVINSGFTGGALSLLKDQWVELRVEIDLDADTQTFYYNNQVLYTGSWTGEVSGSGALNIGAVDLFANNASSVYYDDVSLASPVQPPATCDAPSDIPWASVSPTNGSTPGGGSTPVTVTFDSTGLAAGTYTANLCIDSTDPDPGPGNGTDLVVVPLSLTVEAPTAVTLRDVDASPLPFSAPLMALPAALGLAAAAVYTLRRRR